jgi:hypothetical protein
MSSKYIDRKPAFPLQDFLNQIMKPLMQKVAAGQIKKNLAMTVGAICGNISMLPMQEFYTGKTHPFQTMSSHLSRYKCQPNDVGPDESPLEDTKIQVFPIMNSENEVPQRVVERFSKLCESEGIDPKIFTTTGGEIPLSQGFLRVVTYFGSDKGLDLVDSIWGGIKPLKHVSADLLLERDLPSRMKKIEGRKRGRPKKNRI